MNEVLINHEKISYEDFGSGIPILFIHPPGMGRIVFHFQKSLSDQFRCIMPDLVGQGDSTYDGKSEISIGRFAQDLIQLLDYLNISSVVLFGYSAGGVIAQYIAIHYPARVLSLIISGAYPAVESFLFKSEHRLGIFMADQNKNLLAKILAYSHTKVKEQRIALKKHMYKSNSKVWSKFYQESLSYNCKEEICKIKFPILLLYGSKDTINTYIKFYHQHLSNLKIEVIKGYNHQLPTLAYKSINPIVIEFLLMLDNMKMRE